MTITELEHTGADLELSEPEDVAHIINQRIPGNSIAQAVVMGTEVVALCGYRWIPTRDPARFPVCETCKFIFETNG